MIDSLNIRNYRNLQELTINSLGQVNLITGKNNTGKSSILEAIAIYTTKGDVSLIDEFLKERGENSSKLTESDDRVKANIKALSSLFSNRDVGFDKGNIIYISPLENSLFGTVGSDKKAVQLRFVEYTDVEREDNQGIITNHRMILDQLVDKFIYDSRIGFEIKSNGNSYIIPLHRDRPLRLFQNKTATRENIQFVRTRNVDRDINSKLWDQIALTEKELFVIDALKIIEPLTERIAFVEGNNRDRSAVIKLSNETNVLPLRSMGDGINRILTIILALVNAEKGVLLIDEFENGLHHTVQEQLWNIIFQLAERLDVQVFTTTHSEDCIAGFESVLNSSKNSNQGRLIRLDNINGMIKQVEFNAEELRIANDYNIEIR